MYITYSMFKDIISSILFLDHLNILKILCCFLWQRVAWCVDFDLKRKKKTRFYIYFPNTWCNFWFGDFPNFFNGIGLDPLPPLNDQMPLKKFENRMLMTPYHLFSVILIKILSTSDDFCWSENLVGPRICCINHLLVIKSKKLFVSLLLSTLRRFRLHLSI